MRHHVGYRAFPPGFFERSDENRDDLFYQPPRLVTHIDDRAIEAVGSLYRDLAIDGEVLDLMGSWISHFHAPPTALTVLGMNWTELHANPAAADVVVHDLNEQPRLPFNDGVFDDVVCAVSVDYLTQPLEVFDDIARVLRPGGQFVCTFSNRCFPTKAIRGWLMATEPGRCEIVATYFRATEHWTEPTIEQLLDQRGGDPLWAVHATKAPRTDGSSPGGATT